jgi:hypothetical protein
MKEELFQNFVIERNLSKSSIRIYRGALTDYSKFNKLSLTELIEEADLEEEERIRAKKRKIIGRLQKYRSFKIKQKTPKNTINTYFSKILTFYRHHGIEIPYIPPVNIKKDFHEKFDDIPTIEHIKTALESTKNLKHKAIILFISSSGTASAETRSLTIRDFIKATSDYHTSSRIGDVLPELEKQNDVVPLFELVRSKTDHFYYTCCSPEATEMIIKYLNARKIKNINEKLFEISEIGLTVLFKRINDNNNWGKVGNLSFFHSHALRKFQATAIEDMGLVNTLQGRKSDPITETYFKHDPKRIKEKYMEHLPKLTINKTIVNKIDDEATKELKKELNSKDKKIDDLESRLARLEKLANGEPNIE